MGYRQIGGNETALTNDVGLYRSNGKYVHSVTFNENTNTVRGKGGIEPYRANSSPGPGEGTAWNRGGKLEVWTQRPVTKNK